mmetsp:Transcript_64005/g.169472  ORF Transcript_64005/g.169472 Transcript_64005/m.169472 type:complete len:84 (+) Transcript_64005:256-507(+)
MSQCFVPVYPVSDAGVRGKAGNPYRVSHFGRVNLVSKYGCEHSSLSGRLHLRSQMFTRFLRSQLVHPEGFLAITLGSELQQNT